MTAINLPSSSYTYWTGPLVWAEAREATINNQTAIRHQRCLVTVNLHSPVSLGLRNDRPSVLRTHKRLYVRAQYPSQSPQKSSKNFSNFSQNSQNWPITQSEPSRHVLATLGTTDRSILKIS